MLQGHAVEELHRDEGATIFFADVVNGADVGMIERRGGTGLAAEALQRLGIASYVIGQKFEGNKPAQARVLGLVDNAHAATTELLDDAVVRDGAVDHGWTERNGV